MSALPGNKLRDFVGEFLTIMGRVPKVEHLGPQAVAASGCLSFRLGTRLWPVIVAW